MPRSCLITGSFVNDKGKPAQGTVRFMPWALWVYEEDTRWATLAPEVELPEDGRFSVEVTALSSFSYPWSYTADTPAGRFEFTVPWRASGTYTLLELIDEHRVGPGPKDRR